MNFKNIIKLTLIFIVVFAISMVIGYMMSNRVFQVSEEKGKTRKKYNYQDNIDMDYIEKDSIKYKGDYIEFKDNKLEFVLNFSFPEDVSAFEGVCLSEYIIEDEKGNQIYIDNEDTSEKNSIAYSIESSEVEVNKNTIKQYYAFKLKKDIKCKKVIIKFNKIILYNVNKGNPITKEVNGNWKLNLNLIK